MEKRKIPNQWREEITIPVFKKDKKTEPGNYRGITLLSTIQKLLTKIIAAKIANTGTCEEQQGFRNNRSTMDAIFTLTIRQIVAQAIKCDKPAFLCFVDLTKAFNRVRLKDVIRFLRKRKINKNIMTVIKKLNTNNTTKIKIDGTLTESVPVTTGVRQGDNLSPVLFNLIMDEILEKIKTVGRGYKMGTREIKLICYADDVVLIADNEDDLQRMLYRFEQVAHELNMEISIDKTKVLTIARYP